MLKQFTLLTDEYNVFDPMIRPKEDPAKRSSDLIVATWFGGESTAPCITIPGTFSNSDFEQMHNMCLKIYLYDDLNLIRTGAIKKGTEILKHFNHITAVYNSLCNLHFIDGNFQQYIWSSKDLLNVRNNIF